MQAAANSLNADTEMFAQFGHAAFYPANFKDFVAPRISVLLLSCCPIAICWLVITAVFSSFNSEARRTPPHVRKEITEIVPPFAHSYPPASIVSVVWIVASSEHGNPSVVCWTSLAFLGVSVLGENSFDAFYSSASARTLLIVPKVRSFYRDYFSAFTFAKVTTMWSSIGSEGWRRFGHYFKFAEGHSEEAYFRRHGIGYFSALFSGGRPATTGAHCVIMSTMKRFVNYRMSGGGY